MVATTCQHTAEQTTDRLTSEARARRSRLTESFARGAQTLEDATASALAMVASMERKGFLLRAPSTR